jgi:hypothetical protein
MAMSKEVNQVPACLFQLPNLPDYVLRFQDEQTQVLDKHLQLLLGGKHWSNFAENIEALIAFGIHVQDSLALLTDSTVGLILPALAVMLFELHAAELQGRHLSTDYHLESIAQELIFRLQNPAAEAGTTVLSEVQRLYSQEQMRAFVDWFPFDYIGEQVDISDVIEDFRGVARIERTT